MTIIDKIKKATGSIELGEIVEQYLATIGEADNAAEETFEETALRLNGNDEAVEILETAAEMWWKLEG